MSSDAEIVKRWRGKLAARRALVKARAARLAFYERWLRSARERDAHPRGWLVRKVHETAALLARARRQVEEAERVIERHKVPPIRVRAYEEAVHLIGVMEQGGNNVGPMVEKIIREGGGRRGDPWCGWFMACVYKRAGGKRTSWHWGAVRHMHESPSLSKVSGRPRTGHVVRFTFDHTGMFVRDLGNGYIETIEGNTGDSGAVSDSSTGGDGVYRKHRHKSLVADYLHYD